MRGYMLDAVRHSGLSQGAASFMAAVLLGEGDVGPGVRENFSRAGLSHVLALSGTHVSTIVFLLAILLLPVEMAGNRKVRLGVTLAALWTYAMLTGMSPSVVRAVPDCRETLGPLWQLIEFSFRGSDSDIAFSAVGPVHGWFPTFVCCRGRNLAVCPSGDVEVQGNQAGKKPGGLPCGRGYPYAVGSRGDHGSALFRAFPLFPGMVSRGQSAGDAVVAIVYGRGNGDATWRYVWTAVGGAFRGDGFHLWGDGACRRMDCRAAGKY